MPAFALLCLMLSAEAAVAVTNGKAEILDPIQLEASFASAPQVEAGDEVAVVFRLAGGDDRLQIRIGDGDASDAGSADAELSQAVTFSSPPTLMVNGVSVSASFVDHPAAPEETQEGTLTVIAQYN